MSVSAGSQFGPYEILEMIGAGGMGEVYKARDSRLSRTVAIKILPEYVSQNPELKQRFEREARMIAGLNHPHVCTVYDVGRQDDADFLVMEFLDGETLAQRLSRGPMALDEAIRYAIQVADALDKAHGQGVIHRDLKPANIMLTKSGAKLLDFGLARLVAPRGQAPSLPDMPTAASAAPEPLTAHGMILGTVQYMAPEQIEGEESDTRTDLFAFGAVLYEMITGKRAFKGKSQASLMASILEHDPAPITASQALTPPALQRVVEICLAKEPANRWQTAHDVMLQLQWIAEGGSQPGVPAPVLKRRKNREVIAWSLLAVAVIGWITVSSFRFGAAPENIRTLRFSILPGGTAVFGNAPLAPFAAISPDGRHVAFEAQEPGEPSQLWVRSLDTLDARALPGTEGGTTPFWSPDSRYIGFNTEGKLKKIQLTGGPAQVLCSAAGNAGLGPEATWNRDGIILFSAAGAGGLLRVSEKGGEPVPVTSLDTSLKETAHLRPFFLPDGQHFLYLAQPPNTIYVGSLDGKVKKRLLAADGRALYAAPGFLLFVRQGTLMAQSFDTRRLELSGEPFRIADNVRYNPSNGIGRIGVSVSDNGTLVYRTGLSNSHIAWFDRNGNSDDSIKQSGNDNAPALSPDATRLVIHRTDPASNLDLWVIDLLRGTNSRLTVDDSHNEARPVWSPDGSRIVFQWNKEATYDLYEKSATGVGAEKLLYKSGNDKRATDWSSDGRFILYTEFDQSRNNDIWVLTVSPQPKAEVFLKTAFNESDAHFSPDGRWVAYQSNENGRNEIYVRPFPLTDDKWQISPNGGAQARWRQDGKELFFLDPNRKLMSVEIKANPKFDYGTPKALFEVRGLSGVNALYAVAADGQRFLFPVFNTNESASSPLTVVVNWAAGLKP